ncbi:hypothetical protein A2W14_04205 [Candidatus Gottesmanbacteria bacterium RBG_16_37_8]|uniref:DUF6922 domain-containing protein n=1 Tax=Candidatus Gottesmanbacteria bacterium RBG_16_37_8 TaxID=1798371 RepID=A0A1F5YPG4_9BACT|nr:MAG: hypothetical protein A2W14_04205 [Candidatus Gottesmanbacteria bacterium RBG_16_37_8]
MKKTMKLPRSLKPIFWSNNLNHLNIYKNKNYIIHQILIYGTMVDIRWLFKTYSKKEIIGVFVNKPSKNYPAEVYHFIKNYLLNLKNLELEADKYVTSVSGPVRQRASRSF